MTKHQDIGKRVKWKAHGKTGTGILMVVNINCCPSAINKIIVKTDNEGWTFDVKAHGGKEIEGAGIKDGTKNLYWVSSYELMEKTLDNLSVGDLVTSDDFFRRVLAVLGGEGELKTYAMSEIDRDITHSDLKRFGEIFTTFQLQGNDYSPYQPDTVKEMTVAEISKMAGVQVKVVE